MIKKRKKTCPICSADVLGRTDKKFCTPGCKAIYHKKLKDVTLAASKDIDKILHRNRSTLLEILGKNKKQIKVNRIFLDKKNFQYKYITHYHINKHGKMVHHVYDFGWLIFSDQEVLIFRK